MRTRGVGLVALIDARRRACARGVNSLSCVISVALAPTPRVAHPHRPVLATQEWQQWTGEHTEIPVYCLVAYLAITFHGPTGLQEADAYPIRNQFALWNLLLAVFR